MAKKLLGWPNVVDVLRLPLFASMAAAANFEGQLENLERQCIFYEIYSQFLLHHKRVNVEEKDHSLEAYDEMMQAMERLAFLRMATRHRQGIQGFVGVDGALATSNAIVKSRNSVEQKNCISSDYSWNCSPLYSL